MTSIAGPTLTRLRRFLSLAQVAPYQVGADVQKMVEEDFVAARADDEQVSSLYTTVFCDIRSFITVRRYCSDQNLLQFDHQD